MMGNLTFNGMWGLVGEASPIIKLALLVLFLFSVVSWAVILYKIKLLVRMEKETLDFSRLFWDKKQFRTIHEACSGFQSTPLVNLFLAGYKELQQSKRTSVREASGASEQVEKNTLRSIEMALRKASTREVNKMEKAVTFLATTANTTPFIGLFGTVWGIMSAFKSIGLKGSASLLVIAPGLAEALTTTALGLIAAIPAVVAYNHLSTKIGRITVEMENFSLDFLGIVEGHMTKGSGKGDSEGLNV